MTPLPPHSADEDLVCQTPLFSGIDRETVRWLLAAATCDDTQAGLLFSQGDAADRFFVVLAGRVNLFALTATGSQSIIEVIHPGQTFAEAAIFMGKRFPVNAEAASGTRLLTIPASAFLNRLSQRQDLAIQLFAALARWQRHLLREIATLKGQSPAQRVAVFLLAHAQSSPRQTPTHGVNLPLTMGELASRIGITPESLSRIMARLRPLGVSSTRDGITIGDAGALRQFCQLAE